MLKKAEPVHCLMCETDNPACTLPDDVCDVAHCDTCGYRPTCDACFDTKSAWDDVVGIPATCGECA